MPTGRSSTSKSAFSLAIAILAGACASNEKTPELAAPAERPAAPAFELPDEEGRPVAFFPEAGLPEAGSPALVSFTTDWCKACRKHRPAFHAIYEAYSPRGLRFHSIRVWEKAEDVRESLEAEGAPYDYLFDVSGQTAEAYGIDSTPTVVLIDRRGRELYRATVFDEAELRAAIEESLKETRP